MSSVNMATNVDFAHKWQPILPKVATLSAIVALVAYAIFAIQGAALGAAVAPIVLGVAITAAVVGLAAFVALVAANIFIQKNSILHNLPKWDEKLEFSDPITMDPLRSQARFLANDLQTFNLSTLEELKKTTKEMDVDMAGGRVRVKHVDLGKGVIDLNFIAHFPNLALVHRYKVCPITQKPFVHPYICKEDGHTYEKDAFIDHWLAHKTSPVTGQEIATAHLYPNHILYADPTLPGKDPVDRDATVDMGKDKPIASPEFS